jgi:hypothetical protein
MNIIKDEKFVLKNCNMSVCEILYVCGSSNNVQVEKILHKHIMDSKDVKPTMKQPYIILLCKKNPNIVCGTWKFITPHTFYLICVTNSSVLSY